LAGEREANATAKNDAETPLRSHRRRAGRTVNLRLFLPPGPTTTPVSCSRASFGVWSTLLTVDCPTRHRSRMATPRNPPMAVADVFSK